MIRWLALSVTLAMGTAPVSEAPHPEASQPTIPARFQGEWNSVVELCGSSASETQLLIGANSIEFYESRGTIRAVVLQGEFELALIAELSGEGDTWLSYSYFQLSSDGNSLTDITDGSSG